ncbi:hypothetical protein ACP70R_015931 [Stipagrostis hirtigluma subsp. patula]
MEGFLVSAATGALKPVLGKLVALLGDEYKQFKGVRREVKHLADELDAIYAFLLNKSDEENPSAQDKIWMKDVRELSYDIEDCLDEFMVRVPDGLVVKLNSFLTNAMTCRRIAKAIHDLKIQVKEVGERSRRYRSCETITNTSNATVNQRALAIFENASKLVGIKRPKNELIRLLMKEDGCLPSLQPRVVSIVGFGGMGKTTLASQVYEELKEQFECCVFVSVSRNPDVMKILRTILSEVSNEPYAYTEAGDIQQLIRKIADFLKDKRFSWISRYLIVVDDVWKIQIWEVIKYALLKNNRNSRIITTTRVLDVAKSCCSLDGDYVYEIRPLGPADSKKLFMERIFGSHDKCPEHLIEVSDKILRKCGGLPLAVISISGLLANKPQTKNHWDAVQNSIGRALGKNPDAQSMMQILSLSYFDLPHHLRTCLLYLSIFPENSIIDKRRLVRKWIAEGFIQKENGHTLYELGERCFNELINRSLIQGSYINIYGDVTACQVHDTILDFISLKSEEENFVTILRDDHYEMLCLNSKVRRLSLHASSKKNVTMLVEMDLSHVRSLTWYNYHMMEPCFGDLGKFSLLRVLDLQGCRQFKDYHLAKVWNLFQLRYLSLCETGVCHLSEQIKKLQYLETLNVQDSNVRKLPASIVQLQRLAHLIVGEGVKLPSGIGGMMALEELECFDVFHQSVDITLELGQLTSLRRISIFLNSEIVEGCCYKENIDGVVSSLRNLGCLHSLTIDIHAKCYYLEDSKFVEDFSLDSSGCPTPSLQKFVVTQGFVSKVPNWMGYLTRLEHLILYVKELLVEDILALGRLPALVFVQLVAHESFQGTRVTIRDSDGFQSVRHFDFRCAIPVMFGVGAMPKLENLTLMFDALKTNLLVSNRDFPLGIEHISSLKSIHCILHLRMDAIDDWTAENKLRIDGMNCKVAMEMLDEIRGSSMGAGGAINRAVSAHPKSPRFVISKTTQWWIGGYDLGESSSCKLIFVFYKRLQRKIRELQKQVEERVRNCQPKDDGNCQCHASSHAAF